MTISKQESNYESIRFGRFEWWVNGEIDPLERRMETVPPPPSSLTNETVTIDYKKIHGETFDIDHNRGMEHYRTFYKIMSILLCLGIIGVLVQAVFHLPVFGNAGNLDDSEVSARYISRGPQETGTINTVIGMILDYRAFNTLGESCALFITSCCMVILLRIDRNSNSEIQEK